MLIAQATGRRRTEAGASPSDALANLLGATVASVERVAKGLANALVGTRAGPITLPRGIVEMHRDTLASACRELRAFEGALPVREHIPADVAREVKRRAYDATVARWRCQRCHSALELAEIQLDHIVPSIRGGRSTVENLRVLCQPCNGRKAAAP